MEHVGDFPDALMQVIHGPAGLNIGAETAEEIALSICSEIVTKRQNKDAGNLKSIKGGIHCNA
jgi:xanthine/CO dehydrogenase XdhC/CoxF family maturation factor